MIVLLNGASSSGKTSIAAELGDLLDGVWYRMSVDAFNAMRVRRPIADDELPGVLRRMRAGFHRAVAAMAEAGNDVIVDHVLGEPWRLLDCLRLFPASQVVFVGVRCPLAELERRERARGDRDPGIAAAQAAVVHAHGVYDVECDTGTADARACAARIADVVAAGASRPTAFERLRRELLTADER